MADLIFRVSPNIILGSYTSTRIGQFAKDYGSRFMVIVDPDLKSTGISLKILNSLDERQVDYFVFNELRTCAYSKTIETALKLAKESRAEGIIAIGGGKAINCGRAIAALYNSEQTIYDVIDSDTQKITGTTIPLLAVLTTNRDPLIFTNRIPILDARSKKIKLLKCQNEICKLTLFDPNVFSSLSDSQKAAMELETLCLCVEAYCSQRASFFSDMLVEKACYIFRQILDGGDGLGSETSRDELLAQAGCMASLASGTSSIGAASLLALSINARFAFSRSLISAILLPYIIEDVEKFKNDKMNILIKILKSGNLAETVRSRLLKAGLPTSFKDLNLTIEQLSLAAEDSGELDLVNSLPRSMSTDDLFALVKAAF